jgi:hypothetical protein
MGFHPSRGAIRQIPTPKQLIIPPKTRQRESEGNFTTKRVALRALSSQRFSIKKGQEKWQSGNRERRKEIN